MILSGTHCNNNTMAMVDEKNHENDISGKKSEGSYCESAFHIHYETNTPKRAVDEATSMASIVGGGRVYNTPDGAAQNRHVAAHTDDTTIMQNCGTGGSVVTQSTAGLTACDFSMYNTLKMKQTRPHTKHLLWQLTIHKLQWETTCKQLG